MNIKTVTALLITVSMLGVTLAVPVASADTPHLSPPTGPLPSVTYYTATTHYTVSGNEWRAFFAHVYDNKSYVTFNWANNTTQFLILFDLGYRGLNHYGLEILTALSEIGFPSVKNMTIAFNKTKNLPSLVKGYTNIEALDAGAYPGFSWSVPQIKPAYLEYLYGGIILSIVAATFVLYYVFNRKR